MRRILVDNARRHAETRSAAAIRANGALRKPNNGKGVVVA